ncbi:MAG: hypothetical protein JJU26_02140 [Oceanicaulis sp.]|uniref:hypothetical protein n=1 Tax=Glycocaulis sp. TaxID=1969725 RepID=UPI0025BE7B5C|nr:hypothetical protein [Glycocaulis sp.]MCC5980497.1 hypothetical protein [Oceanicaulis sp.]MCH8522787.1 hypothetical protein [Glycocaulis sp.]
MELLLIINIAGGALLLAGLIRIVWPYATKASARRKAAERDELDRDSVHTSAE